MLLTLAQRHRAIAAGVFALVAIGIFIGVALATLLHWQGGVAQGRVLSDYTLRILVFTLWQAGLSTLLSVILAMPLALALARRPQFPGRIWVIRLLALPMGLPVLIGALGIVSIWGRQGVLNQALSSLGLSQPVSIYGLSGILIAHVFFNLPLATRLMLAALERLPGEYWLLSANLGLRPGAVFRFVEWPAIRSVLPGAAGLVFMLCATSFTLVLLLGGGPAATTLEVAIYQSLRFDFDPPRAIALALLQIGLTAIVMALLNLFPKPDDAIIPRRSSLRRFDGHGLAARFWDVGMIAIACLFLLLPLLAILQAGLRSNLAALATSSAVLIATRNSLLIALVAGLVSVLTALAIISARAAMAELRKPPLLGRHFQLLLGASSSLVLLVPPVVIGTGWFLALHSIGANTGMAAAILVTLINAMMALPFVIRVLEPAMATHRQRTQKLCASLGIDGMARLRLVDMPSLAGPALTAFSFAMALSLGDLGAVAIFGASDLTTLPWLVYSRLSSYRTHDADGLALLLGILCLGLTIMGTLGLTGTRREERDA